MPVRVDGPGAAASLAVARSPGVARLQAARTERTGKGIIRGTPAGAEAGV